MRFEVHQPIAAPCDKVEAAFLDPAFYAALGEVPNLGAPEVLGLEEGDGAVEVRVRYAFTGDLAPAA